MGKDLFELSIVDTKKRRTQSLEIHAGTLDAVLTSAGKHVASTRADGPGTDVSSIPHL